MTPIPASTVLIWISQWEYQCCGSPIAAGDSVDLTVHKTACGQPWEAALADRISLAAEHHAPPEDSYHLRVRVERVLEARAHRELGPDGARRLLPSSGEVADVAVMRVWDDGWQPARHGGTPEGWILQATILRRLPPREDGLPYGAEAAPPVTASETTARDRGDQE